MTLRHRQSSPSGSPRSPNRPARLALDRCSASIYAQGPSPETGPCGTGNLSQRSARVLLREAAGSAAHYARDDATFFGSLQQAGVLIRYRYSDRDPAQVTGYAVALPGHNDADGNPIWYSGGRLAADLTLLALHNCWTGGSAPAWSRPDPAERRALWADVIRLTTASADQFKADPQQAADTAQATADALRITARLVRGAADQDLRRAAGDFDRAAREAYGAMPPPNCDGSSTAHTSRPPQTPPPPGCAASPTALGTQRTCRYRDAASATAIASRDHSEQLRQPTEAKPVAPGRDRRGPRPHRSRGPAP